MKTIDSIIKEFSDSFNIITTGFRQIDTRKRGWHPGELCIIGGRPRMGKTAFILSVIKNILKEDFPIALFTATDTIHIQFLSRIVSHLTNKNLTISTAKNLKLLQENPLDNLPLYLHCKQNMNLAYIRSNAEILVHKYNVKCIFIESIQSIFHAEEIDNPSINKELICIELKNMAQELHVPFILTSDLSETLEQRKGLKGKQPKITDLVYADSITNIADSIFLLFNPTYYKRRICRPMEEDEPLETFYVNIAQNKYESTGIVSLTFNPNNGFIEDDSNIPATPSPALQKFIEEFDLIPLSNMFD